MDANGIPKETRGWLPEGFENQDVAAPSRIAVGVRLRVVRHERNRRFLFAGAGIMAVALAVAVVLLPTIRRQEAAPTIQVAAFSSVSPPSKVGATSDMGATSDVGATSRSRIPSSFSTLRHQEVAPTVTLAKAGKTVAVQWDGPSAGEYEVYRCSSPRFDQCSLAGVVKGTRWVDGDQDRSPSPGGVVYYRVEIRKSV